ncbi:hypothetical protein ALC53_09530 [Atta colombica]|uniref:Uncharacterized protein n=1 Tax=Atta colombica TaxID=520822 RepID=A0A195B731_9HYME|nr:hypothetical protein ALC53_09530 [Atta colombica]
MKAHCRIKKLVKLTGRAGATCSTVCLPARLASQARIPPLYRMPPGFNELNYSSLRVIREVDDRDTDEFSLFHRNALTVSLLSAPLLIPDPVAFSCRTQRVIYDRRMDRSGPTGRTSIHVLMPVRYGHNDGNVFILPTLRHDDRSTN